MNRPRKQNPELEQRHYYAMLGLSTPTIFDDVVGAYVPHKLSSAEEEFMLEHSALAEDFNWALDEAEKYFQTEFPTDKVYYKNSRWSMSSPLQVLSVSQKLFSVGCRYGENTRISHHIC